MVHALMPADMRPGKVGGSGVAMGDGEGVGCEMQAVREGLAREG